jgi:hypothetical protein
MPIPDLISIVIFTRMSPNGPGSLPTTPRQFQTPLNPMGRNRSPSESHPASRWRASAFFFPSVTMTGRETSASASGPMPQGK